MQLSANISDKPYALSFEEARAVGARFYCSLVPCKAGHDSPRYASDRTCVACRAAPAVRIAARDRSRRWHAENRDAANQTRRLWYKQNRTHELERMAGWARKNPEKRQVLRKRRRAAKLGSVKHYTHAQLVTLWTNIGGKCACCAVKITLKTRQIDHIIPLAGGGSNEISNIQFLCGPCNKSKGARDPITFMQSRGLLV
jgi:5-methylcytosine-specific restriction endonuclease McrA